MSTNVTAEYFLDPFCHRCWASEPAVRRLRFTYEDVEWTPRLVPRYATATGELPDGVEDVDELNGQFRAAGAGMPVAEAVWSEATRPASWTGCAAIAAVRERDLAAAERFLRRLQERTFLAGAPPTAPADLIGVATDTAGVDSSALRRDLSDGTAREALAGDLRRARDAAALLETADTRGAVGTLPLASRFPGNDADRAVDGASPPDALTEGEPAISEAVDPQSDVNGADAEARRSDDSAGENGLRSDSADADVPRSDESDDGNDDPPTGVVAPPTIRFGGADATVLADPRAGYADLKDAANRLDPNLQNAAREQAPYGTQELKSRGLPADMAEQFADEDFAGRIERFLSRFGRALLPEVETGADASRSTCRLTLYNMRADGSLESESIGDTDVWVFAGAVD